MTGPRIAPAAAGDLAAIEAYTAARSDTCMIVRSNLRRVGLAWTGARYQAQYVVAWRDDRVVGVVGHNRNGVLLIQADEAVAELAVAATTLSGRPVGGFL
ncbi:MAG: hypothetical protein KC464_12000, partial [Myxococcales bacterium]|nr:hypothetical protein [Myxococcales bacterium]